MKKLHKESGCASGVAQAALFLALVFVPPGHWASTLVLCASPETPVSLSPSPSLPAPVHGDVNIEKDRIADNDVITVGHSVFVEGNARQSVAALGGSVIINGTVGGDVAALGGDVWLGPSAIVRGDLIVMGGKLYHAPSAQVTGKTLSTTYFHEELRRTFGPHEHSVMTSGLDRTSLLWRLARVLAWFIVAVIVILFVPVQTVFAMDRFERDFAKIGAIGLLAFIVFIGLLALFSMMIKIIVGIPLVFLLLLSLFAMWAFGAVVFYLAIGRLFARWVLKRPLPMALYALCGLLLWSLLSFIPIVRLFIPYLVFILSLGISMATKFGTGKPWFLRSV